ncbi:MAG: N-acetylmuramoyl-L-alanine amidase [Lachnospiraceae bacterium]|nr:N-acetylmuramoyl-L-alanine amidase [Lachnospiraceae bacterium]
MEKEKESSKGASRKKRAALARRRKIRRIQKTVLTVLAALLPVALIVLIIVLAGGNKPDESGSSTPPNESVSESRSESVPLQSTEKAQETDASSEEPDSSSESETVPAASSQEVPETPVPPQSIVEQETVWSGYYPAALPIEVQDGIRMPSWVKQDLLLLSDVNRPGRKLDAVRNIIIHYVGNTGSSAKDNRDYFQSQQDPKEPSYNIQTSSHFIVDLDGTVLQCVPIGEVAYANYPRNYDTISVESCHINDAGEYTPETYASLVKLSAWLLETHNLSANDLLRHDDVRPVAKSCPKWFTDHPDAWETFKNDVRAYMDAHPDIGHEFP